MAQWHELVVCTVCYFKRAYTSYLPAHMCTIHTGLTYTLLLYTGKSQTHDTQQTNEAIGV